MAKFNVRYLVKLAGAGGSFRYFWQPSSELRALGHGPRRLPDNWSEIADPAELEAAAIREAAAINAELDTARQASAQLSLLPVRAARDVKAAIVSYRAGDDFKALRQKTRRGYDQCLVKIEAIMGDVPVRAVTKKMVKRIKDAHAATPTFANAIIRVLRIVCEHAVGEGWIAVNPARKPKLLTIPFSGLIWPAGFVAGFAAEADALGYHSMGTAVILEEWIGQREGDVLRLPRTVFRSGVLNFGQSKTGMPVSIDVGMVPHLMARLERELARQAERRTERERAAGRPLPVPASLIVSEDTGLGYREDHFRHLFAKIRRAQADRLRVAKGWRLNDHPGALHGTGPEKTGGVQPAGRWHHAEIAARLDNLPPAERARTMAEEARIAASFEVDYLMPGRDIADPRAFLVCVEDLQFMHGRHTAITRLAESGCDTLLISAVSGHEPKSVEQIIKRYAIKTRKLARLAFQKRMTAEGAPAALENRGGVQPAAATATKEQA